MRSSARFTAWVLVGLTVGLTAVPGAARLAAQSGPKTYYACYVPLTGTVYRIKETDVKPACTSTSHVEFSWVDGANALRVTDPAGGDLTGLLANASVVKLLGRALATTAPTAGQVLTFDGTAWTPTNLPAASFPAAAGDVSGTYPSLTVSGLQGRAIATMPPANGQFLGFNGSVWQPTAAPSGGGVTSHAALTGLLNDDHSQYLLSSGVRNTTSGFAVAGTFATGSIPATGGGTRLMWYPGKSAFRAGNVNGTEWDDAQVGTYSTAFGRATTASGNLSTAFGFNTIADGNGSTAMGAFASTNSQPGSFVYGDASSAIAVTNTAANQFTVRASGGFRFRTASDLSTGCDITAGNLNCTGKITRAMLATNASGAFDFANNNGFVASGPGTGAIPATGAGIRLMWYPGKAAFRAGGVEDEWDDSHIGVNSTAMGLRTTASGLFSTAMGAAATASGVASTAMGNTTTASGDESTALGAATIASGELSTAMGYLTTASGARSTAVGIYASTNLMTGSFVYGDASTTVTGTVVKNTADNQFTVRAAGGFQFRTSSDLSTGCSLPGGSGTWSCTSSRLAKEGFENLNADEVLSKIARMPIQAWSYRTEPGNIRHVGPAAQDFRAAFGLGDSDEAISLVDIDGINLLGVQTLEKRTRDLQAENARLRSELDALKAAIARLEAAVRP